MKRLMLYFLFIAALAGCKSDDSNFVAGERAGRSNDSIEEREEPPSSGKTVEVDIRLEVEKPTQRLKRRSSRKGSKGSIGQPAPGSPSDGPPSSGGAGPSIADGGGGSGGGDYPSGHPGDAPPETGQGTAVDILFYLGHKQDGQCWSYLGDSFHFQRGARFLPHLGKLSWRIAFAHATENTQNAQLYGFRSDMSGGRLFRGAKGISASGSPVKILKSGDGSKGLNSQGLSYTLWQTLTWEYYRYLRASDPKDIAAEGYAIYPPVFWKKPNLDPLKSLGRLLKANPNKFARKKSRLFVVMTDMDNYYYSLDDWRDFLGAWSAVDFVSLSTRRQVSGGALNIQDEAPNFDWISCADSNIAKTLAFYIKRTALDSP